MSWFWAVVIGQSLVILAFVCVFVGEEKGATGSVLFGCMMAMIGWLNLSDDEKQSFAVLPTKMFAGLISGTKNEPSKPRDGSYKVAGAELQREFESIRSGRASLYQSATNEIKKSAIWSSANAEVSNFVGAYGSRIDGWKAKVYSIKTDHGGDSVNVQLVSSISGKEVTYSNGSRVKKGSAIYNMLYNLNEGDVVEFGGVLVRDATEGVSETSITEYGSLRAPEFEINLTRVVPERAILSSSKPISSSVVKASAEQPAKPERPDPKLFNLTTDPDSYTWSK